MELTIHVDPVGRTVRLREVHALAAGDSCSVVLEGVRGADVPALRLALYRDAASDSPVASCPSFAPVRGHPTLATGDLRLDTAEMAAWFEAVRPDPEGPAADRDGPASGDAAERAVRTDGWLVVSEPTRTWAACRVPVVLRPGAGVSGVVDPTSIQSLVEGLVSAAMSEALAAKADLVDGKVPAAQLPSYVDDVLEYDAVYAFPKTGEGGKIYVAKGTNKTYRWEGAQYVELSQPPELDDTVTEPSSNGVKSSGIWSWVKSLLPGWLTSDYAEPATVESVEGKADKADLEGFATEADLLAFYYPDGSVTSMDQITTSGIEYAVGEDGGAYVVRGSGLSGHVVLPWKVTVGGAEYKVTAIGEGAFAGSNSFNRFTAPMTVKSIEGYAFSSCSSLASVDLPSATSIGGNALFSCGSLASVHMPSATSIGSGAFSSCSSLASVHMPSATSIGSEAFSSCSSLATVDFGSSPKSLVPVLDTYGSFVDVPTSCRFIVPLGMYDEWTSAPVWSELYAAGYKFEGYASTAQLANKADKATTLAGYGITDGATKASLAPEYSPSSAYAVGSIVYHDGNIYQCKAAIADGGEAWNAEHWGLRKLDGFFTESNSLLTGTIDARLPYPLYAVTSTGLLKDRAINTTSLASVTVPDNFTDLLIRASVASSLSVTMPEAITTKYGDTFPGEAGEYLITITKTGAAEAYVRTIKLEVANA